MAYFLPCTLLKLEIRSTMEEWVPLSLYFCYIANILLGICRASNANICQVSGITIANYNQNHFGKGRTITIVRGECV